MSLTDELRAIAVQIPVGGIAVLKSDRALSNEAVVRIKAAWEMAMSNPSSHRCIVLDESLDLSIVRPDDAALNAAYSAIFGDAA